jgi:integrase
LSNRRAELLNLRVRDIDFLAGELRLEDTKNGEPRTVPLTSSVRELLRLCCHGKAADAFVFTRRDGTRVKNFRDLWWETCISAGWGKYVCKECGADWVAGTKYGQQNCSSAKPTMRRRSASTSACWSTT